MRGAAGAGARSDLAISNCARPDHEQDAGGAEICCRPDRRPGMTQDLAGASAAPARGRSPAVDRVGSEDHVLHTRARCRRSASHACGQRRRVVRRAESRRARCARSPRAGGVRAVAARWWATGHRGERGASEEHTGQCAVRDSQISKVKQEKQESWVLVDNKPCSGRHQRAGRRRSCCASKSRRPSSRIVSSSCALTDGSARLLAGSAITVDGRQEDQRCAARRQTTTLAPARRGFLAARQMVSGRRWRHGRDELRGRHVAMRPSY